MKKTIVLLGALGLASCARYAPGPPDRVYVEPEPEVIVPVDPLEIDPPLPTLHEIQEHPEIAVVTAERAAFLRREGDIDKRYFWALEILESSGRPVVNPLTRHELNQALPLGCTALERTGGDVAAAKEALFADERVRSRAGSRDHLQVLLEFSVYYRCPEYLDALNRYILATYAH